MPIPDYQSMFLPVLKFAADQKEHSVREAIDAVCLEFKITPEEQAELLPSGKQNIVANRTGWAKTYLSKANLLEKTRMSHFKITQRGLEVLNDILATNKTLNNMYLKQFPEFEAFQTFQPTESKSELNLKNSQIESKKDSIPIVQNDTIEDENTPLEVFESAWLRMRRELEVNLLQMVKKATPEFFEKLVVQLLVTMGYGGSIKDAGKAMGKSGDEGIDGIIKEDKLGLDVVYIQAKRWEGCVGRPEIQKFVGALSGQRARKGVFITTGHFSSEAKGYVNQIDTKLVLIDGEKLSSYMVDYNVGVSLQQVFELKTIDELYFEEE